MSDSTLLFIFLGTFVCVFMLLDCISYYRDTRNEKDLKRHRVEREQEVSRMLDDIGRAARERVCGKK